MFFKSDGAVSLPVMLVPTDCSIDDSTLHKLNSGLDRSKKIILHGLGLTLPFHPDLGRSIVGRRSHADVRNRHVERN